MQTSPNIAAIAAALAKAQGQMRPALKDASNPAFRSKYADLAAVMEAARGPLSANKIALVQDATLGDNGISVTTHLLHSSGEWLQFGPYTVPVDKQTAHGVGSATSYAKRYGLTAALGIVAEVDDDGNAASSAPPPARVMPPAEYQQHKQAIEAAGDSVTLRKQYTAGYVAAQKYGDADAMTRLTKVKDERKAKLEQPATEPEAA